MTSFSLHFDERLSTYRWVIINTDDDYVPTFLGQTLRVFLWNFDWRETFSLLFHFAVASSHYLTSFSRCFSTADWLMIDYRWLSWLMWCFSSFSSFSFADDDFLWAISSDYRGRQLITIISLSFSDIGAFRRQPLWHLWAGVTLERHYYFLHYDRWCH